ADFRFAGGHPGLGLAYIPGSGPGGVLILFPKRVPGFPQYLPNALQQRSFLRSPFLHGTRHGRTTPSSSQRARAPRCFVFVRSASRGRRGGPSHSVSCSPPAWSPTSSFRNVTSQSCHANKTRRKDLLPYGDGVPEAARVTSRPSARGRRPAHRIAHRRRRA